MSNMFLGIDTSNYTSSCAVFDENAGSFYLKKQLLPVAEGALGLRQSDAVFHHVKNLAPLLSELSEKFSKDIKAIGYSYAPCDREGSYMPCFCVGQSHAAVLSASLGVKAFPFSHQAGHVAAALCSVNKTELFEKQFVAFHVSGGTTDVLLIKPHREKIFDIFPLASSLDLKAGQAVDRVGAMLGLRFPSGPALEELALKSCREYKIKPFMKDGSCSFSGVENKCKAMLENDEKHEDIAKYCIDYITAALCLMTEYAIKECGDLPVVYAGGVMSDTIIRNVLQKKFGAFFASPEFSSDNAAGTAYLAYLKNQRACE